MDRSGWGDRLLLWVVGGWLFLTIAVGYVATANFRQLEPERWREPQAMTEQVAQGKATPGLLRYIASELNRHFFSVYGWANLALAVLSLVLLSTAARWTRLRAAALVSCAGIAAVGVLYLTPTLIELGRQIDFVPRVPASEAVQQFYWLHGLNEALELMKLLLLVGLTVSLVRRP